MKNLFLIVCLLFANTSFGQNRNAVSIVDFVKVKNGKQAEALFYYENNWKVYRDIAFKKGYISSYKLLKTAADSTNNFDLILVTEYADSVAYNLAEERFQPIIKATRPGGPILLNEIKPSDFRQNVFFKKGDVLFSSDINKIN